MANNERAGTMKYKDKSGTVYSMLPKTSADNVSGLKSLIDEAKVVGMPVTASSSDGVAYIATVPGITALSVGVSFTMVPSVISTSQSATLNVNNLGAKNLRIRVSGYSGTTSSPATANWLAPNKPVRVMYDGMWWIADVMLTESGSNASDVSYDKTSSGLTSENVQAAIDELAEKCNEAGTTTSAEVKAHLASKSNPHGVTAAQAGAIPTSEKGAKSGVATLGTDGKVPTSQLPAMDYAPSSHVNDTTKHITADERTAWNDKASKAKNWTIRLKAASWATDEFYGDHTQTASISDIQGTETELIYVMPKQGSEREYYKYGIWASSAASGSLTFSATNIPEDAMDVLVSVIIQNVGDVNLGVDV